MEGEDRGLYTTTQRAQEPVELNKKGQKQYRVVGAILDWLMWPIIWDSSNNIRYGVVANIAVSHTAAGGSIPPIGDNHYLSFWIPYQMHQSPFCTRDKEKQAGGYSK
jgi:hypothetical protein